MSNLSQSAIVANLDRLQVTRIVVAHRLSTIERADHIIVLGDGSVREQGTYQELIAADGAFRHLVERQQI